MYENKELEAECTACGRKTTRVFAYGNQLKPGDPLWHDPQNDDFDRCPGCKRTTLIVTRVTELTMSLEEPPHWWKMPEGSGD